MAGQEEEDYVDGYVDGAEFISTAAHLKGGDADGARPKSYVPLLDDDLTEDEWAIVESCIPTQWFTDFYSATGMTWKFNEDPCKWCHTVHPTLMKAPPAAAACDCTPAKNAVGNAIEIKKLAEETEEADVRRLVEAFGDLRCVKLCKVGDGKCYAIVSFVKVDDAERAMKHLKGQGYDIEWSV